MSTKDTRRQESTGTEEFTPISEQAYQSFTIGTDDEGYDHHFYAAADEVVVYDGRELDDRVQLDGATVRAYVEWVTQFRSWDRMGQFYSLAMHHERAAR